MSKAKKWRRQTREIGDKIGERFLCLDCDEDTGALGEYYMVHNHVWNEVADQGMLCICCLEDRLGRRLTSKDFTSAPINHPDGSFKQSARLRNRLSNKTLPKQGEFVGAVR